MLVTLSWRSRHLRVPRAGEPGALSTLTDFAKSAKTLVSISEMPLKLHVIACGGGSGCGASVAGGRGEQQLACACACRLSFACACRAACSAHLAGVHLRSHMLVGYNYLCFSSQVSNARQPHTLCNPALSRKTGSELHLGGESEGAERLGRGGRRRRDVDEHQRLGVAPQRWLQTWAQPHVKVQLN